MKQFLQSWRIILLFIATIFLSASSSFAASWTQKSTPGISGSFTAFSYIDDNNGWAVGNGGLIAKTTDGGETWTQQTSGTSNYLISVYFTDANNGWAVGVNGTIVHTSDGGTNWSSQTGSLGGELDEVFFVSATQGYIAGGQGIQSTSDGGSSWSTQYNGGGVGSIYFTSTSEGWAASASSSSKILHTTNGGATWTTNYSIGNTNRFWGISFFDNNHGCAVGDFGMIYTTANGGSSWTLQSLGNSNQMLSVSMTGQNEIWIAGTGGVYYSSNGGSSWTNSFNLSNVSGIFFRNSTLGWAATSHIYKYADNAPSITSFTPSSGPVGTLVTITGTDLNSPTAFTIGGVSALPISNDGSTLVAMVMPGATTDVISITTVGGSVNSASNFTITARQLPNSQQGNKLVGTGNIGAASQGYSVKISADGNTAIVGGIDDNNHLGAAWIYTRSGGVWTQQSKLVGTGAVGAANQGSAVDISADGNTAVIGGQYDNSQVGAVWVFTRTAGVWSQQGSKLVGSGYTNTGIVLMGYSVSMSADGNTILVGGPFDHSSDGAAWIFTRSAGVWSQQGSKLVGTGATSLANQGISVALSADGNTAIIGGSGDNSGNGAAWVFTLSGGVWSQQGSKLVGTGNTGTARQGRSVALSADGNTAIMGGDGDNSNIGAAWVFTRTSGIWSQQGNKLVGTGNVGNGQQGVSVSLSADGDVAMIGSPGDNSGEGAAWIFKRSAGTWSQNGSKLLGTGVTGAFSVQGRSVSISADGKTAFTGGFYDNSQQGAAWAFTYTPPAVTVTGTLNAFTSCANQATTPQTFTVSGIALLNDITLTAPSGFEISTSNNTGFGSTVTLTPTAGTVNTTTIYVRMNQVTAGTPSGNITVASAPTTTQNVAVSGTANAAPVVTITTTESSGTTPNDGILCAGDLANLDASTSTAGSGTITGYLWNNVAASTTNNIDVSTANNNYTVTVTNSNGCSTLSTGVNIVVNTLATASISGTTTVAKNTASPNVTFTGVGTAPFTFSYTINGGATQTVSTTGMNTSVNVAAPTNVGGVFTYNLVEVQDANGCMNPQSGSAIVTVTNLATATVTGTTSICLNQASGTLTASFTNNTGITQNFTATIGSFTSAPVSVTNGSPINILVNVSNISGTLGTFDVNIDGAISGNVATASAAITVSSPPPALAPSASAVGLTTLYSNGATYYTGMYFDITTNVNTTISGFDVNLRAGAGQSRTVSIYYRSGTYVGHYSATGWTLLGNFPVTSSGLDHATHINLPSDLALNAGRYGWFFYEPSNGVGFTAGGTTGQPYASDANMTIYVGNSSPGAFASPWPNRIWNGAFYYRSYVNITVTGGGTMCSTDAGIAVGLNTTVIGMNYQLVRNGNINVGAPVAGTGSAISFGLQTVAGTYTVQGVNANGCTTTMNGNAVVIVNTVPTANFTTGATPQCLTGNSFTLTNTSVAGTGTINSYAWTYNGTTQNTAGPFTTSYAVSGTKAISLTIGDDKGCSATISKNVVVNDNPSVTFTEADATGLANNDHEICSSGTASFNPTVGAGTGTINSWVYKRGVTTVSSGSNAIVPNYVANVAGTYSLTVGNTSGCSTTYSDPLALIVDADPTSSIDVTGLANQCINQSAGTNAFTLTSHNTTNITNYQWYIDGVLDGANTTSAWNKTFATAGGYNIALHITDNKGCFNNNASELVRVYPKPSITDFTTPTNPQCLSGNSFDFIGNAGVTNVGTLTGAQASSISNYAWNYGDTHTGNSATNHSGGYTYGADATYTVTLQVTTNHGCLSDVFTKTNFITVWPMPHSIFTTPTVGTQSIIGATSGVNSNGNGGQLLCHSKVVYANSSTINAPGSIAEYRWDFGDSNVTNNYGTYPGDAVSIPGLTIVKHEYPVQRNINWFDAAFPNYRYNVKLTTVSDHGCLGVTTIAKDIKNGPDAIINITTPLSQCLSGNAFDFGNPSQNNHPSFITNSHWEWGDGTFEDKTTYPPKTYASAGNYTAWLTIFTNTGCMDTASLTVSVLGNASTPSFTHDANTTCTNTVTYTNTTVGAGTYTWSFPGGNPSTSTQNVQVVTYATPGAKTATLSLNGGATCGAGSPIATQTVYVGKPTPNFTTTTDCSNQVVFTNTSTNVGTTTYAWTFGDGGISTATNPTHAYTSGSSHNVTLVATGQNTCTNSTGNVAVSHGVASNPLVVDFTISQTNACTQTILVADGTTGGTGAVTYRFKIDAGSFNNGFPFSLSNIGNGDHTLTVEATASGCVNTLTKNFTISTIGNPTFVATLPSGCDNTVSFTGSLSGGSFGAITYLWDFADASTGSGITTTHAYTGASNSYPVTFKTITITGCTTQVTQLVNFVAPATLGPKATFTYDATGTCGTTFNFTNTADATNPNGTLYTWNFGDGSTTNVVNPTKSFANGTFQVTLTAANGTCTSTSAAQTITVAATANGPATSFDITPVGGDCSGSLGYNFVNTSQFAGWGWVPSGNYVWTKDNGSGPVQFSTNTYVYGQTFAPGTYTITLTATGNVPACASSFSKKLVVGNSVTANFTPVYTNCTKQVSFNNTSTNANGATYAWDFGDGHTSTATSPTNTYTTSGTYTVSLTATVNGCSNTKTTTVSVGGAPVASFNIVDAAGCSGSKTFVNTSTVDYGALTYSWTIHNGAATLTSTATSPTFSFANAVLSDVTLTATNASGCSTVSAMQTFTPVIGSTPATAAFTAANLSGNLWEFTNTTTGTATSYLWDFGDNSTTTTTSLNTKPQHTFGPQGIYNVKLTAINGTCSTTYVLPVTVNNTVVTANVVINVNKSWQCITNNNFTFLNYTIINGWGWLVSSTWSFDDGTPTLALPNQQSVYNMHFATAGTKRVTLTAVTNTGGVYSSYVDVQVDPLPCANVPLQMSNPNNGTGGLHNNNSGLAGALTGIGSVDKGVNTLNLYPNPNNGTFTLDATQIGFLGDVNIKIVDMLGREVYNQNRNLRAASQLEFNGLNLEAGKYNVIMTSGAQIVGRAFFAVVGN